MDDPTLWKIIHSHFEENPQYLVSHHLESYDDFFQSGIFRIFREKNPLTLYSKYDESIQDYRHKCILYMGGKDGTKLYFGKPVIYDKGNAHYMYPNEARLRNMTYGMTVHYDIEVEFIDRLEPGQLPTVIGPEHLATGDRLELDPDDANAYLDEIEKERVAKEGNFKTAVQTAPSGEAGDPPPLLDGGAGKDGPTKRKKRAPVPYKMTTQLATLLREANEKSVAQGEHTQKRTLTLEKIYLGKFPIMVQSNFCILHGLSREVRHSFGECRNDPGGYFIIGGKEKTVIAQEKFADNMLYIKKGKEATETSPGDSFVYSAEIRSVSENASKPVRKFSLAMVSPTSKYSFGNIVVNIPNVQKAIPLFIVFRALGISSDYDIISTCLLDMQKYESMIDTFIPSVHDAGCIMTQKQAIDYLKGFTKYSNDAYIQEILHDYLLPHIGEGNYLEKAYYLGHMVFRLLSVYLGMEQPTDRDHFKYKRIEQVGPLLYAVFQEYYTIELKKIHYEFESRLYYKQALYSDNLFDLINDNYREVFQNRPGKRPVNDGFRKAFKGNWGAESHTKRIGVVQDINRLSFHSLVSHLRKTNLPLPAGVKLVGPRVLHSSQWGYIDPVDTPDGGNIGLHKQLAITTYISRGYSREQIVQWLRENVDLKPLAEFSPATLACHTKVLVNGYWAGSVLAPMEAMAKIRLFRRNALIPIHTSATFEIRQNTIYIYTDAGRLCRPIFYKDEYSGKWSFEMAKSMVERIREGKFTWRELLTGFNRKRESVDFHPHTPAFYTLSQLYTGVESETNPAKLERFLREKGVVEYIDPSETENTLISFGMEDWLKNPAKQKLYTHMEIHPSFLLGVAGNHIIFAENNPLPRDLFSCGQSRQACSMYHTNYHLRTDKTAVVLHSGQVPFVKTRYMTHVDHEENPYGENAIVAIMCYTGYNVEDAVLINEGSLRRGMFHTTYFTTYETHEENTRADDFVLETRFHSIESTPNVIGLKPGYDYSRLDAFGLIRENTPVDDKTVLIGMASNHPVQKDVYVDKSKTPKKGQLGYVDRAFITEGEEGERIAKVRIRENRVPALGDKFASRSGQKGTVGMIIPEKDMPFTKDGLRPDIIVNPHAIPTRMTIGQLVECITGKASAMVGSFADCTALNNTGSKIGVYGEILNQVGFHSSGNEILYNGMTGEQIESAVFIGPNYYMRLKHMVKDKINYRARGPRTALTRQPVSGRANDGGLRIGEMERDVLISHGISNFLTESMMVRGDECYLAVCNLTGMVAIYNPDKNLFMSPMADGPIQFVSSVDGKTVAIDHITRFGRDFSIVSVPYSLKLLIQELQTINVQLRILTESSISQMDNLLYSKNIEKLTLQPGVDPKTLVANIRAQLERGGPPVETPAETPASVEYPDVSPAYVPSSAEYANDDTVSYRPGTPPSSGDTADYTPPPPPADSPEYKVVSISPSQIRFPRSPNTPPGEPVPVRGGDGYARADEIVYYRGSADMGLSPNHPWKITKYGDQFLTIRTDQAGGATQDTIQVVHPSEIIRASDIPAESDFFRDFMPHSATPVDMPLSTGEMPGLIPPSGGIQFNPVIKIVNGDDHSQNTDSPTNGRQRGGDESPKMSFREGGAGADAPIQFKSQLADPPAKSATEGGSDDGGFFGKFKNFVIKKLQ